MVVGVFAVSAAAASDQSSNAALLERYSDHAEEFRRLGDLLRAQDGHVFGPRYEEYVQLKSTLGLRTFQGGSQAALGLRFPVSYRSDLFQFTRGSTRGYAWMPNPPALLQAESDRAHRFTGELPAIFVFADSKGPSPVAPKAARRQYAVVFRHIEGPWYLYSDNNPYHAGW